MIFVYFGTLIKQLPAMLTLFPNPARWPVFLLSLFMLLSGSLRARALQTDSLKFNRFLERFHQYKTTHTDSAAYYLHILDMLSGEDSVSAYRYRYYVVLGEWNNVKRDIPLAIKSYNKALELANRLRNEEFIVVSKFNLGACYGEKGDYDKAVSLFKEVESGLDKVKNNPTLFSNQFRANMVMFYLQTNMLSAAFKYSNQMKGNLKTYEDSVMYYMSRLNLLNTAGKYKETTRTGKEALKKIRERDVHFLYQIHTFLGIAYKALSRHEKAFGHLFEARALSAKLGIESGIVEKTTGLLYLKTGDHKNAVRQFNRVIAISRRQHSPHLEAAALLGLKEACKTAGNYREALRYLEEYMVLNDSLRGAEKVRAIRDTEDRYKLQDKEKAILQQRELNILQEALLKEEFRQQLILIVFLICAVLLGIRQWLAYKKTSEINKQLIAQKNQIECYAMDLKNANLMRDKLFAMISHDLRSPISSLIHSLEDFQSVKPLNHLIHSLNNVQLILNNLLKWAQIQLSNKVLAPGNIHLEVLLNSLVNQFTPVAHEKSINIITDYRHTGTAWADEESLQIILRNIFSNAVKFTGENGYIRIISEDENEHISITIRDSGTGISSAQLEKLFVYPESQSGTHGETGTGLGMMLTKELVEKMKGEIRVKSKKGVGTSVQVTFPAGRDR